MNQSRNFPFLDSTRKKKLFFLKGVGGEEAGSGRNWRRREGGSGGGGTVEGLRGERSKEQGHRRGSVW